MSQRLSNNLPVKHRTAGKLRHLVHRRAGKKERAKRNWWMLVALPVWLIVAFVGSSSLVSALFWFLQNPLHISLARYGSPTVLQTVADALVYLLAITITLGVPYLVKRRTTTLKNLGLDRLMTWTDIGLAPLAFLGYILIYSLLSAAATHFLPFFSADQAQDIGFKNLTNQVGYLLAFTTLVVIAPVAEETLFRGYLYGKLRRHVPMWLAMVATSLLFGAFHGQWNVGLDVFVMSMVACGLRELTGSIWAGILLHMIKNVVAFYLLFLAPVLGMGIGG